MQCEKTFLREPVISNLEAMGNELLTLSMNLWLDNAHTKPYDLTNYTGRAALKHGPGGAVTVLSATVTSNATVCNVIGLLAKVSVEALEMNYPFIFDLSVDNAISGDSFCLWTGTIVFREGAST